MQPSPHLVIWDDASAAEQLIPAAEMMQRLGRVLDADYREKQFRGEPRYELRRAYPGGLELQISAGHIYDDREALSMAIELWAADPQQPAQRPLISVHLSGGIQRVKASQDTAWLRARNGSIVIVGESLGGIVEVQQ
jgi:hypothetical protein